MRKLTCHQCEICNEIYFDIKDNGKEKAIKCESIGKPKQLANIGDKFTYKYSMSGLHNEIPIKIYNIIDKGHYLIYKFMSKIGDKWQIGLYGNDEICGNDEFMSRCYKREGE